LIFVHFTQEINSSISSKKTDLDIHQNQQFSSFKAKRESDREKGGRRWKGERERERERESVENVKICAIFDFCI